MVHFAKVQHARSCPLRSRCPVKLDRRAGAYVLKADLVKVNIVSGAGGPRPPRSGASGMT